MDHRLTRRCFAASAAVRAAACAQGGDPPLEAFFTLASADDREATAASKTIEQQWRPGLTSMLLDLLHLPFPADHPTTRRLVGLLQKLTHRRFGRDMAAWQEWIWARSYEPHADYALFKGHVLGNIDPRMRDFFPAKVHTRIRLDQVEWGGVKVNGIPPLVDPDTIPAAEAKYLGGGNVVFGIAWNGEARAYPKRILAWHEMARDRVGGLDLNIVYCTLCGTVIPYMAQVGGKKHTLGTSGLLYESSKLMFDEETKSLWPTLEGRPAIGPLSVGAPEQLPKLEFAPVVTTTWDDWRRQHPATRVLSLRTGHNRDYNEGTAYRDYFATDRLMFAVSRQDRRLKAKEEVLVVRRDGKPPLAFPTRLLDLRRILTHSGYAILTTASGANRVYEASGVTLARWDKVPDTVADTADALWKVSEDSLTHADGRRLKRVPAHRAFWFGWYAQFPETMLVGER